MRKRLVRFTTAVLIGAAAGLVLAPASASDLPSGQRESGQAVVEPAYDDVTGNIVYLLTPAKAPMPSNANQHAVAPLYIVEYPVGSSVGRLNCMLTVTPDNCPTHNSAIAQAAMAIMPGVYSSGAIGHDHLVGIAGTGGDFNVAWQVVLVLFTNSTAADTMHLTTLAQVRRAEQSGDAIEVPTPITFNCSYVSPAVYAHGTPL